MPRGRNSVELVQPSSRFTPSRSLWRGFYVRGYNGRVMELPEIEKFMPLWVFFGLILGGIAAFAAVLIVLATTSRRRDPD